MIYTPSVAQTLLTSFGLQSPPAQQHICGINEKDPYTEEIKKVEKEDARTNVV